LKKLYVTLYGYVKKKVGFLGIMHSFFTHVLSYITKKSMIKDRSSAFSHTLFMQL